VVKPTPHESTVRHRDSGNSTTTATAFSNNNYNNYNSSTRQMPPLEGFDASSLRRGSSLYDNIVDEVNIYGVGLKEKIQTTVAFRPYREDVVATRDIIVGQHPLCEPDTLEWEEFVLGKGRATLEGRQEGGVDAKESAPALTAESTNKRTKTPEPTRKNPSDLLDWLEAFTGICLMEKHAKDFASHCGTQVHSVPAACADEKTTPLVRPTPIRNRVLYPIAKYPSRLDSTRLVEQRRRFLANQINFKPVGFETRRQRKHASQK
jgi:hypothetical protein